MTEFILAFLGGGAITAVLTFIITSRKLPSEIKLTASEADSQVVDQAQKVLRMQGDHLTIVVTERDDLRERVDSLEKRMTAMYQYIVLNPQFNWPHDFVKILQD